MTVGLVTVRYERVTVQRLQGSVCTQAVDLASCDVTRPGYRPGWSQDSNRQDVTELRPLSFTSTDQSNSTVRT